MQISSLSQVTLRSVLVENMFFLLVMMTWTPLDVFAGYPESNCCENKQHYYYYSPPATPPPKQYPFLPAPPGQTPTCARNGKTFCVKIDTYPTELIRYLLYRWGRTYGPFIVSESDTPFIPPKEPDITYGYEYPPGTPYEAPQTYYDSNSFSNYNYTRLPTTHYNPETSHQYQEYHTSPAQHETRQTYNYLANNNHAEQRMQEVSPKQIVAQTMPPVAQSYWWNHRRHNRATFPSPHHPLRVKRQVNTDQLCPVRSQYLTPQAAMNKEGNWMYVVNMNGDTRYVQQVKTENCINPGGPCNNLCSPAPGYRSSCRQLMVQKRLVALAESGDRLLSDVFWFPSCCICEIKSA